MSEPKPKNSLTGAMSGAEWEVMRVVWSIAPCSAREVTAALGDRTPPAHRKTVATFLHRLVNKGLLTFSKRGRAYYYTPTVAEEACKCAALDSFARTVFGCSTARAWRAGSFSYPSRNRGVWCKSNPKVQVAPRRGKRRAQTNILKPL